MIILPYLHTFTMEEIAMLTTEAKARDRQQKAAHYESYGFYDYAAGLYRAATHLWSSIQNPREGHKRKIKQCANKATRCEKMSVMVAEEIDDN